MANQNLLKRQIFTQRVTYSLFKMEIESVFNDLWIDFGPGLMLLSNSVLPS